VLYLIGARGTGKSTVGRALAARLGWSFADADEHLEAAAGTTIADIFQRQGEAAFRELEAAALAELSERERHVIATGGGVVLREANHDRLAKGFVVWLQATPEDAFARMQSDPTTAGRRPNLTSTGGVEELRSIMAAREPFYRALADYALDTTDRTPADAAEAIVSAWARTL